MKVLITGAAGFIGSQLAHRLWKEGAQLVLIDNFSFGHRTNLVFDDCNFENQILEIDIRDRKGIKSILEDGSIDYIYNLAGIAPLPDCQTDPQEAIDVNLTGFVNLLEHARLYGVKKVIQASTNAIYENAVHFPTSEQDETLPSLIYPNTKYAAERFAESYCKTYGMHVTCIRFSNVYGPHVDCMRKQPPFVAYMIRELYYGRKPVFHSDGEQKRDYIFVDDLTDLALAVLDSLGFDVVNAASNRNYSVNEMYEITKKIMNQSITAEYADDHHYWAKYEDLFRGKYPMKESVLNHEINKYSLCDNSYALKKYGWFPKISMEEGLKRMVDTQCRMMADQQPI